MNTIARFFILPCIVLAVGIAAKSGSKGITPQKIGELTADNHRGARAWTIRIDGLQVEDIKGPGLPERRAHPRSHVAVRLSARNPETTAEMIRELRFPSAFEPPAPVLTAGAAPITPTTPVAFETVNVGWTIKLRAKEHGKVVGVYGVAEYTEAAMVKGGYGPLALPVVSAHGELISPNVIDQPRTQTTTTRFQLYAVPGEPAEVVLYRGGKAEKHRITVTEE